MRDRPNGADLLEVARAVLRDELLALNAEKRYAALMIANAMSIAERQLRQGDDPERRELASLEAIVGPSYAKTAHATDELRAALIAANRELARRLRAGDADPGRALHAAALAHLRGVARQRLLESNPKALPKDDRAQRS